MRSSETSTPNSGLGTGGAPVASASTGSATPDLRQPSVDQRHGHRSLADASRAPLARSVPHVAGREEAWQVGLERQRLAFQRPPSGGPLSRHEIVSRYQVAALVVQDSRQSYCLGPRDASDGDEEGIGRESFRNVAPIRRQNQLSKATLPFGGGDLDPGSDHDVAHARDPVDEVLRHRRGECLAPDQDRDQARVAGEAQGGLTGRVATADNDDAGPAARQGFAWPRAVVDPSPQQTVDSRRIESPPLDAGGDQQRTSPNTCPVRQRAQIPGAVGRDADQVSGQKDLGAEAP